MVDTKTLDNERIGNINERLSGDVQIAVVPIDHLHLLEKNARFMPFEMFQKLVNNVKKDGGLTSVPFCMKRGPDDYLVLSGNHRVMAAKEAGLEEVLIMYTEKDLTRQEQIAIQLSHNAIEGKDDMRVLKSLWDEIDDLSLKYYSGLDDKTLEELEKNALKTLSAADLEYKVLSFLFLPEEVEDIEAILRKAKGCKGDDMRLTTLEQFERFLAATSVVKSAYNIKNSAVALELVLRVFEAHLEDLQEGWMDDEDRQAWVPVSTILGGDFIPPDAAQIIKRAIDRMVDAGDVPAKTKWKALELLSADYLAGA